MRKYSLVTLSLLAACSGSNNSSPPNIGQWVGTPCCSSAVAGYYYTQLPTIPKVGQTLVLNFDFTGNNPVFVQHDPAEINPPTIHLLLYQKGDDGSCQGDYNYYRLFGGRTNLVFGTNQVVSVPLSMPNWVGCYGNSTLTDARIQTTLDNLLGAGVTFGGQYFAGHGVSLSSGSAIFKVNSFGVK